jgi:high affinity Mn2+ porin
MKSRNHAIGVLATALLTTACLAAWGVPARAAEDAADIRPESRAVHGQATLVAQGVGGFASPYSGAESLQPRQLKETIDATLFAGVRPWSGGELWVSPEIDQGFGLSDTLGAAGFPSAEAYKVGKSSPYLRLQRLFLRQTLNLGGTSTVAAGGQMSLAGRQAATRLVVTLGKFSVGDVFDTNRYAHDPRNDFLNWSLVDSGTFDYAADAWGYSYGAAAELYTGPWTLRLGLFNLSKVPNGETLETGFGQNQLDGEIEHRHRLLGHDGAIRLTAFRNDGRFARYDEALALARQTGQPVDLAPVRRRMTRLGLSLNVEQQIGDELGLFARAGLADGNVEVYDFTDIDRSLAVGGTLDGAVWGRKRDRLGLAFAINGITAAHRAYLAAGGLGVLVGDGQLPRPGDEHVVEAWYAWRPFALLTLTADYQHIASPAYNRDRGPADLFALRAHGEF